MDRPTERAKTDPAFEWSKAIEVGHADIDQQHQKLFELLRELRQTAGTAIGRPKIKEATEGLKSYALSHFAHEEGVMDSFDYDERKAHKAAHAAFIKNVEKLDQSLDRNTPTADSYGKVVDFIYNWLISHINNIDRTMVAKLNGGHQDRFDLQEVSLQTSTVIENAFIVAGEVERASALLGTAANEQKSRLLSDKMKDASERLINLLSLAGDRVQFFGCSDRDMAKLRGMQGAMNASARGLLKSATKDLIAYGARIILGQYDLPLGAGAFMSRKAEVIDKLLHVIGGIGAVEEALRENVTQALRLVEEVKEVEASSLGMKNYDSR